SAATCKIVSVVVAYMSHGTDALYGFAAQDPRRTTPEVRPQQSRALSRNILANVALAFVATTCVWTLWSHLNREEVATLAERFAALPAADTLAVPSAAPAKAAVHSHFAGLLDARNIRFSTGLLTGGRSLLADSLAT